MDYKKPYAWAFALCAFFLLRSAINVQQPKITVWDNFGYYLVLPQTFIQHDPGNRDRESILKTVQSYDLSSTLYQIHVMPNGNHISQYPLGMSFFYAPAFFTGHLIARSAGYKADGYSPPYQYSLVWFEVVYVLISLFFFIKVLKRFFNEWLTAFLVLICFFGTNYYSYVISGRGMPHQYLFLLYVLLLHLTLKWTDSPKRKYAVGIGLVLGLMTITRPTDALAFLIPLFWGVTSIETFKQKWVLLFKTHWSQTLWLLFSIFAVISVQLVYWKIYAGSFIHYSYINNREIFEFARPHTLDFLFSFRKGWFIYTPVMLIAMVGLMMTLRKKTTYSIAFFIYTVMTIYVLSSWSCWWYATSFGQRSMIQSYPVYIICLGFLLQQLFAARAFMAWTVSALIGLTILFNQFQLWQVDRGILLLDRVTPAYYFAVFGKTTYPQGADTLLMINHDMALAPEIPFKWRYRLTDTYTSVKEADSAGVYFLSPDRKTWPCIEFNAGDMQNEQHAWYKVSYEFKLSNAADSLKCNVVETMVDEHVVGYAWQSFPLYAASRKREDGWMYFENYYLTPVKVLDGDKFSTYIWFGGEGRISQRNFKVEVYKPKEQ